MLRAAAIVLLSSLIAFPALAAEVATVAGIRGEATVTQGGRSTALAVGLAIEAGAVIRTLAPGRVKLKFIDGSVVVIGDESTFKVDRMSVGADGTRIDARFVLDIGLISQTVAPAREGRWAVRTPTAVTAVRGTEYLVEVKADATTEVNIRSGSVRVEPVEFPVGLRELGGAPRAPAIPVMLDRESTGTRCDGATGTCSAASPLGSKRMRELDDRLAGV